MRDKYIHYGSSKYDPNKFVEPKNNPDGYIISKPQGGLWASKVNSEWGWKDWCRSEDFHTDRLEESFTFELSAYTTILPKQHNNMTSVIKDDIMRFNRFFNLIVISLPSLL